MSNYIDLVLVKHDEKGKTFLFRAPAFSHIAAGTEVTVDTIKGKTTGTAVADSITVEEESDELKFIAAAANATLPLQKVLSEVHRIERTMEYDDEKKESGFAIHVATVAVPV